MRFILAAALCTAAIIGQISAASAQSITMGHPPASTTVRLLPSWDLPVHTITMAHPPGSTKVRPSRKDLPVHTITMGRPPESTTPSRTKLRTQAGNLFTRATYCALQSRFGQRKLFAFSSSIRSSTHSGFPSDGSVNWSAHYRRNFRSITSAPSFNC